jgi:hypothetical protein
MGRNNDLSFFVVFVHSLQTNFGTIPRLCHNPFLPDPIQFITIYLSSVSLAFLKAFLNNPQKKKYE